MKILVLAGGADQIALINELHKRGHEVVLLDYFENPPAKPFADKHIVASTLDVEAVEYYAKEECVSLICTACTDQALLTVAYVSERLGLPCYINYQTGLNVTNKAYMKKVLTDNGIPTSQYAIIDKPDLKLVEKFQFPLVVKPVDCNSSKGVKKVNDDKEFLTYVEDAIKFSRTNTAIVEEFKEGIEVSADFYVENGEAKLLCATTSQKIKNRKSFTIVGSDYPAINEMQEKEITRIATEIATTFNLKNTPLLIQLIVGETEINVIEFSARMGGGSKYKLIEVLSGVNIMEKYVDLILGGTPTVSPEKQVDFCKMIFVYCTPGTIDHFEGLDNLVSEGYIKEYFLYKTKGMTIDKAETSGDRALGYMVVGKTLQEVERKGSYINGHIRVISQEGIDMMMHNLMSWE